MTIHNSVVSGNSASDDNSNIGFGGGIDTYNGAIYNSTVSGNYGTWGGGVNATSLDLVMSTVDNNQGDGIFCTNANIQESTISGNSSSALLMNIVSVPISVTILNSTLTLNGYGFEQTSSNSATSVTIVSSIFADNGCCDLISELPALSNSSGYNLIMSTNLTTLPPHTVSAEPKLAPLAYHGGPTRTHALLPDSPAIWAGKPSTPFLYDQRGTGFPRSFVIPPFAYVDIGAYQRQIIDDEIFAHGFGLTPSG